MINILLISLLFAVIALAFRLRYVLAMTISPFVLLFLITAFSIADNSNLLQKFKPLNWLGVNSLECYYGAKGNGYLLSNFYCDPIIGSVAFLFYMTFGTLFLSIVNNKIIKKLL